MSLQFPNEIAMRAFLSNDYGCRGDCDYFQAQNITEKIVRLAVERFANKIVVDNLAIDSQVSYIIDDLKREVQLDNTTELALQIIIKYALRECARQN